MTDDFYLEYEGDLSHCPKWLRITDRNFKCSFIGRPESDKLKKESRKGLKRGKVPNANRKAVNQDGEVVFTGTYEQIAEKYDIPVSTIQGASARGQINKKTKLYFRRE